MNYNIAIYLLLVCLTTFPLIISLPLALSSMVVTKSALAIHPRCTARPKDHTLLIEYITQLFRTSLNVKGVPTPPQIEL